MAAFNTERVLSVHHWNDTLFSFTTTRDAALRFHNGHFVMIGLEVEGKPLLRAYSIASANYEENLEFLSIKVQNGPLTSRLQHLKEGDTILVSRKPVGTLVVDDLKPGKHLFLFGTGTGLAPFMSIIKDPDVYERFDKVILVHGVRWVSELAYADFIGNELLNNEFFGEIVRDKLVYYPTVTREPSAIRPYHRTAGKRQALPGHRHSPDQPRDRPRHDLRQPAYAGRHQRHAGRARLHRVPGCGTAG